MDGHHLWRCQQFFLHCLLKDRKYTYPVFVYQTTRAAFDQLHAAARGGPAFVDMMRIEGTGPARAPPRCTTNECTTNAASALPSAPVAAAGAPMRFLVQFASSAVGSSAGTGTSGDKFGKAQAESVVAYMQARGITRLFLVSGPCVTPQAHKVLERAVHVEFWPVVECLSGADTHDTVPACMRLSTREKKDFYALHSLSGANMARMLTTDRMAKYWDHQPGDLIEIHRQTHVGTVRGEMRVVVQA